MSADRMGRERLEISLPEYFVKQLEDDTGFRMADLDGVKVRITGDPPRMVFTAALPEVMAEESVLFDEVILDETGAVEGSLAGSECNGKDNKWQDQSTCANLITTC